MSKSMVAVITAVITAVVSVCSTLVIVNYKGEDGVEKEAQIEIFYDEKEEADGGNNFESYKLSGSQQTVTGDTSEYKIDIKSARISIDTEVDGMPADVKSVLVTFSFTNNSDKPKSFAGDTHYAVYQNGVELEDAYGGVYDMRNDDSIEWSDIKPGATVEFEIGFNLNNETADLVVEVTDEYMKGYFTVSRTFYLS